MNDDSTCIKIIQLTDCHLLGNADELLKGWPTYTLLEETLHAIKMQTPKIDSLILTGDLSQDGCIESYQLLTGLLNEFTQPRFALPGNHDDFNNMQTTFDSSISCQKRIEYEHWQILLIDSTEPNNIAGRISETELEWLLEQLGRHRDKHTLIAMHHYPLPTKSQWMDELGLLNASEFFRLIKPFTQIKAIITGHIHHSLTKIHQGIKVMSTPSTCFQFKPESKEFELDSLSHGYRWLELAQDGHINTGVTRIE